MSDPTTPQREAQPGLTSGDPLAGAGAAAPPPPPPPGAYDPPSGPYGFAPGSLRLAGWWRRVGAAVIDGIIIGAVAVLLLAPLGIGAATVDNDTGVAALVGAFIVTTLVFVVVAAIYAPVMMARTNGQTVGRMATGIRVVRANGQPMTFGFAALREIGVKGLLVGIVGNVTFGLAGLIDVLWPLWDEEHRALHDMVVNTRVVEA